MGCVNRSNETGIRQHYQSVKEMTNRHISRKFQGYDVDLLTLQRKPYRKAQQFKNVRKTDMYPKGK